MHERAPYKSIIIHLPQVRTYELTLVRGLSRVIGGERSSFKPGLLNGNKHFRALGIL